MAKIIRPTYPIEFSIGLLLLIFVLSGFLSFEIFSVQWQDIVDGGTPVIGMVLAGTAVVVMSLILWEEFLFPIRVKPEKEQIVFRNHFTKLKTQVAIYCTIPVIVCVIFVLYKVSLVPFLIWAVICLVTPLGKLISGIHNYNDFLKITDDTIEYKNNEHEGVLLVKEVRKISLVKDDSDVLHKIRILMINQAEDTIDLDEMELEAYLSTIENFVKAHYGPLLED